MRIKHIVSRKRTEAISCRQLNRKPPIMAALELAGDGTGEDLRHSRRLPVNAGLEFRTNLGMSPCFNLWNLSEKALPDGLLNRCPRRHNLSDTFAASPRRDPNFLADVTVRHPTNDNANCSALRPLPQIPGQRSQKRVMIECTARGIKGRRRHDCPV